MTSKIVNINHFEASCIKGVRFLSVTTSSQGICLKGVVYSNQIIISQKNNPFKTGRKFR